MDEPGVCPACGGDIGEDGRAAKEVPLTADEAFEILERLANQNEWMFDSRELLSYDGRKEFPCIHTPTPVICIELAVIAGIRGAGIDNAIAGHPVVLWPLLCRRAYNND